MRNINGKNSDSASKLTAFAKENNLIIDVIELDVTNDESIKVAIAKTDGIDVLTNNAGTGFGGPTEAFSGDEVLAQLDLNIVGPVRVSNAVLPVMRAQKSGLIIQVSSTAGRAAFPGFGVSD